MTWFRRIALVLVAASVLLYAGQALVRVGELRTARAVAAQDLAEAFPSALAATRDQHRRAVLAQTPPTARWDELACSLESVEAGWVVEGYDERCVVRAVSLLPSQVVPEQGCRARPLPWQEQDRGVSTAHTGRAEDLTSAQYVSGCPQGALDGTWTTGEVRILDGSRPAPLRPGSSWTLVVTEVEVSRSRLGCDPWAPVLCSPPGDTRPAWTIRRPGAARSGSSGRGRPARPVEGAWKDR